MAQRIRKPQSTLLAITMLRVLFMSVCISLISMQSVTPIITITVIVNILNSNYVILTLKLTNFLFFVNFSFIEKFHFRFVVLTWETICQRQKTNIYLYKLTEANDRKNIEFTNKHRSIHTHSLCITITAILMR